MSKKLFPTTKSLESFIKVVVEAKAALDDTQRTINSIGDKELFGALSAVCGGAGLAAGVGTSFAALYALGVTGLSAAGITSALAAAGGIVGGGMAAGVAVLAAPVVALGASGAAIAKAIKNKKLKDAKWHLLVEAKDTYNALEKAIEKEVNAEPERKEYLKGLELLLSRGINDLHADVK